MCRVLCVLSDWWAIHPPVSVWIGVLGFLGVLLPLIRDISNIGKREKAIWTFVVFALLLLEIKSVYQDRNEHDQQQSEAREREAKSFETIALGITESIHRSDEHFQSTMQRSDALIANTARLVGLSEESIGNITGGNSFVYVRFLPTGNPNVAMVWSIPHGRFAVHQVTARVVDVDALRKLSAAPPVSNAAIWATDVAYLQIPELTPNHSLEQPINLALGGPDHHSYNVFFSALNGDWVEEMRGKLINGQWVWAIRVSQQNTGEKKPRYFYDCAGFPQKPGEIKW
jgi:hypothetical protein